MKVKHYILKPIYDEDGHATGDLEWRFFEFDSEKQPLDAKGASTPKMAKDLFLASAHRARERLLRELAVVEGQIANAATIADPKE